MRSTRRKAFTLVELLVVIGIIAVLVSILLPSLNRARQTAIATKCLNNVKQLVMANQMYLNENKGKLPFPNWDGGTGTFSNAHVGWLYDSPQVLPMKDPTKVNTGSFWPFLKNYEVYHCPTHNKAESGSFGSANSDTLTSYLMNGAVCDYGQNAPMGGAIFMSTITMFKPDDVILWEADERGGSAWNDGSSYPSETFDIGPDGKLNGGLTARHGKTAVIGCFDGHAEWMSHKEFYDLAIGSYSTFKNRIWCAPSPPSTNGH